MDAPIKNNVFDISKMSVSVRIFGGRNPILPRAWGDRSACGLPHRYNTWRRDCALSHGTGGGLTVSHWVDIGGGTLFASHIVEAHKCDPAVAYLLSRNNGGLGLEVSAVLGQSTSTVGYECIRSLHKYGRSPSLLQSDLVKIWV